MLPFGLVGRIFTREVSIGAASQFDGTEFQNVRPQRLRDKLIVREVNWTRAGSESMSWAFKKVTVNGRTFTVLQSLNSSGTPAANTSDAEVNAWGHDIGLTLDYGDYFAIVTSGGASVMKACVTYEEVEQ